MKLNNFRIKRKTVITAILIITITCLIANTRSMTSQDIDEDDDLVPTTSGFGSSLPSTKSIKKHVMKNKLPTNADNENTDDMSFLQTSMKSKKANLRSFSKNSNNNIDELDEEDKGKKFIPYNSMPAQQANSKTYLDKKKQFQENLMTYLQSGRKVNVGAPEGFISKFERRKFVEPGQDIFLGFMKYLSNTAETIHEKKANDKRNNDPNRFQ